MAVVKTNKTLNNSLNNSSVSNAIANNTIWTTSTSGTISPMNYYTSDIFQDPNSDLMDAVAKYMTEDEIDKLLTTLMDRETVVNKNKSKLYSVVKKLIRERHFTEDFIMKYYDYVEKEDILELHTPDITSQEYAQLALLIMNDDRK